MNRDIAGVLRPLLALALFAFIVWQTGSALRASGVWERAVKSLPTAADDPLVALDTQISPPGAAPSVVARDPFSNAPVPAPSGPVRQRIVVPVAPAKPLLTAIVWDTDPRALIRWKEREWTVRAGGLFDEFQVLGITRDQVTLAHGGETLVLQRKPRGE
jgi:hypothetical protein